MHFSYTNMSPNTKPARPMVILYADDDPEDRMLAQEAFEEGKLLNKLCFVEDGEALMDYLHGWGKYADRDAYPLPGLILLDLNMPKKDGWDVLRELKADEQLRKIPVVVLTTSDDVEDVEKTYHLGVSSFITKPVRFESLVETVKTLSKYWFELVQLPR